jgi:hypothetical protein
MSYHVLTEEPLQFGEGGRLFRILTLPSMPARSAGLSNALLEAMAAGLSCIRTTQYNATMSRTFSMIL